MSRQQTLSNVLQADCETAFGDTIISRWVTINPYQADELLLKLRKLQKEYLIDLEDGSSRCRRTNRARFSCTRPLT
jgi:hypothetical protein